MSALTPAQANIASILDALGLAPTDRQSVDNAVTLAIVEAQATRPRGVNEYMGTLIHFIFFLFFPW